MKIPKPTINIILIWITSFLLFYECEYKNNEDYYPELNADVPEPDLTVDLNLSSDTIYFYKQAFIKLQLKLTNKELYRVKFLINNVVVQDVAKNSDMLYYLILDLSQKTTAKLKIEIYTSTESGSIADVLRKEEYQFQTKEWMLIYVPDKPVLSHMIVDGRLKISWTPVKSSKQEKYYINTSGWLDSTYNTWYIDSVYVGGLNTVNISCKGDELTGYGINSEINYPLPKLVLNNKDSFLITWNSCPFYQNVSGYMINADPPYYRCILGPEKTSYVHKNGNLGSNQNIDVAITLKKSNHGMNIYNLGSVYGLYPASNISSNATLSFPVSGKCIYYHLWNGTIPSITRYNTDSNSGISSYILPGNIRYYTMSPNDKYLVYEGDNTGIINILYSNGLSLIKSFARSNIAGYRIQTMRLSDQCYGAFYDQSKNKLVVADLLNETIITEIPVPGNSAFKLSADGKYLFNSTYNILYKIENNTYSILWSDSSNNPGFSYFEFFPDNSGQIAVYDGNTLSIKNCSDFSTVKSFPFDGKKVYNVDFNTNKILAYNFPVFYIYSLIDGNLLKSVPVVYNYDSRLFNNIIFVNNVQCNLKVL